MLSTDVRCTYGQPSTHLRLLTTTPSLQSFAHSTDLIRLVSMARWPLRWRSYQAPALCGIAVLNIAFLVFLHTTRPSSEDLSPAAEPNIIDSYHAKERQGSVESSNRRIASNRHASKRTPDPSERISNLGMDFMGGGFCRNLTPDSAGVPSSAEAMPEETFQWQTIGWGLRETFVFSAYYDDRVSPAVVRIIGISSGMYVGAESQTKHCQLWLPNERHPRVTLAEYNIVPETHDRSYAASLHICRVENLGESIITPPYAVSLVIDECQSPSNVLRVLNQKYNLPSPEFNVTVCVTPLNFNYNNIHQLVEMVEVNRLFGAQRFLFYNYSTGNEIEPYLRWYEGRGVLRVIPWHIPVVVDVWPQDPKVEPEIHYFGQLAALNDCLYRNMLSSRFVVFTDLDELIVPRRHDNWLLMLRSITAAYKQQQQRKKGIKRQLSPGAFMFRHVFFRTDWKDRAPAGGANNSQAAAGLKLNTLVKTTRETRVFPAYVRSKCIAVAKMAAMVGVHSVLNFIDDANTTNVVVEKDQGLLHHYRQWMDDDDLVTPVADERMQHFANDIISAVNYVHSNVGLLQHSDVVKPI